MKTKFKAVTKEGNIIDVASIQFMEDGSCIVNDEFPIEEGKLIQFTGLKDRDGTEIYDGDVVQRGVILFDRGKFQGYYYESNGSIAESWEDDLYQEKNMRVWGNIFQNPELLKS